MEPLVLTSLLLTVGSRVCAIPVAHVLETMRPLPIEPIAGAPPFVLGVAIVRGAALPVISVSRLVASSAETAASAPPTRFVTLRVGPRTVVLAVDGVERVVGIDRATLEDMPPLLDHMARDVVEAIAPLDDRLLMVLRAARMIPDEMPT